MIGQARLEWKKYVIVSKASQNPVRPNEHEVTGQKKCRKMGIETNISQYFPLQNKDEKPFKGIMCDRLARVEFKTSWSPADFHCANPKNL